MAILEWSGFLFSIMNACYFTYGIDKPGFCYADGKLYIIGAYREGLPSVEAVSVDVGGLNLK